jgi:L-fucose isomerase-like protein
VRCQGEPAEIVHGDRRRIIARLRELARYATVRRLLAGRIGLIGRPSDWLIGSGVDRAAVRRRWGTRFVDIGLQELTRRRGKADDGAAVAGEIIEQAQALDSVDEKAVLAAARLVPALRAVFARHRLQAATLRCFSLIAPLATTGCLALSRLNDEGLVCGCEGDVPAAFSMLLLFLLTGEAPFLANPAAVDAERDRVVMAHCTVPTRAVAGYRLQTHFETGMGVALCGAFAPGPATVFKAGGPGLDRYFVSAAEVLPHRPRPGLCRTQVRLQLREPAAYFLHAPLANHHVLIRGDHARRIDDFMRFSGALRVQH